jgi:hypothetical protein
VRGERQEREWTGCGSSATATLNPLHPPPLPNHCSTPAASSQSSRRGQSPWGDLCCVCSVVRPSLTTKQTRIDSDWTLGSSLSVPQLTARVRHAATTTHAGAAQPEQERLHRVGAARVRALRRRLHHVRARRHLHAPLHRAVQPAHVPQHGRVHVRLQNRRGPPGATQ